MVEKERLKLLKGMMLALYIDQITATLVETVINTSWHFAKIHNATQPLRGNHSTAFMLGANQSLSCSHHDGDTTVIRVFSNAHAACCTVMSNKTCDHWMEVRLAHADSTNGSCSVQPDVVSKASLKTDVA